MQVRNTRMCRGHRFRLYRVTAQNGYVIRFWAMRKEEATRVAPHVTEQSGTPDSSVFTHIYTVQRQELVGAIRIPRPGGLDS